MDYILFPHKAGWGLYLFRVLHCRYRFDYFVSLDFVGKIQNSGFHDKDSGAWPLAAPNVIGEI